MMHTVHVHALEWSGILINDNLDILDTMAARTMLVQFSWYRIDVRDCSYVTPETLYEQPSGENTSETEGPVL